MLWYKAWLETRARFLVLLFAITGVAAYSVVYFNHEGERISPLTWYNFVLQRAHNQISILWLLSVSLLMMGGLLHESGVGASDFTLALPVSRARLMMARIWMGYAQSIVLAIVPWTVMFLIDLSLVKVNFLYSAWFHAAILVGGGSLFAAWALLVSSLIAGPYTAPAVALGGILVGGFLLGDPSYKNWSPYSLVTGQPFLNLHTNALEGPIPWVRLAVTIAIAAALTWTAIKVVERKDF